MGKRIGHRLEQYTLKRREEVLLVHLESATGEADAIMIYGGFSSSLMRPTAFDPEVPLINDDDKIISLDRLKSPYDPEHPQYIEADLNREDMEQLLQDIGL